MRQKEVKIKSVMLTLIAAVAANGCIGKDGKLPWHLPEDLKHFKNLTMGKTVLMGRKTWESIPAKFRPLSGRRNVIITRQADFVAPSSDEVEVCHSLDDALARHANEDLFIIGGAEIYRQTIDRADRLEITQVKQTINGDAFFPVIEPAAWQETNREEHEDFAFVTYTKCTGTSKKR